MPDRNTIFTSDEISARKFRGFNPAFVRRVWAKRRELGPARQTVSLPPKDLQREHVRRQRIEELERRRQAGKTKLAQLAASTETKGIVARIALETGISLQEIFGPSRERNVVATRHRAIVAVALARPQMSLPQLGRMFKRDHTTILHALQKHGVDRRSPTSSS